MTKTIMLCSDYQNAAPWDAFQDLLHLRTLASVEVDDYDSIDLAVFDYSEDEERYRVAEMLRDIRPNLPILVVNRIGDRNIEDFIRNVQGYGQIRVHTLYPGHGERLLTAIHDAISSASGCGGPEYAIALPLFNEASRFSHVQDYLVELQRLIRDAFPRTSVFFIDDGSSDHTGAVAQELAQKLQESAHHVAHTRLLTLDKLDQNTRKAGTWIHAIEELDADYLLFSDADNSFVIEDIARMFNLLALGYHDIIAGTKDFTAEERSPVRSVLSAAKRVLTRPLLPKSVYDSQTGLKALSRTALHQIAGKLHVDNGLAIDLEILYVARKSQLRVMQLPVVCIDRDGSHIDPIKDALRFLPSLYKIPMMSRR